MQFMKYIFVFLIALIFWGCSSPQKATEQEVTEEKQTEFWEPTAEEEQNPDPFFVEADFGEEPSQPEPTNVQEASTPQFPEPEPVNEMDNFDPPPVASQPSTGNAMHAPASDCS